MLIEVDADRDEFPLRPGHARDVCDVVCYWQSELAFVCGAVRKAVVQGSDRRAVAETAMGGSMFVEPMPGLANQIPIFRLVKRPKR